MIIISLSIPLPGQRKRRNDIGKWVKNMPCACATWTFVCLELGNVIINLFVVQGTEQSSASTLFPLFLSCELYPLTCEEWPFLSFHY